MDKRLVVVSNSSPIMNLAIIGQLHLIQELFGEIIIPKEVWAELIIEIKYLSPFLSLSFLTGLYFVIHVKKL